MTVPETKSNCNKEYIFQLGMPGACFTLGIFFTALLLFFSPLSVWANNNIDFGYDAVPLSGGTQSTILETGTASTMLQTGTDSTLLETGTQSALIHGGTKKEGGPVTILFLVDASLSMRDKMSGSTQKMNAAKQVLQKALVGIPADVRVGVRVFGHFAGNGLDCEATSLLVPPGTGNRGTIMAKIRDLKPRGMTPLTRALQQTAERDLARETGRKTVILITDGAETCGGDPCEYVRQLPYYGVKLKVDIVGLDLGKDKDAKKQLDCIATTSGGKYYDADTAAKLIESVSASVSKAIAGQVVIPGAGADGNIINPLTPPELVPIVPMGKLETTESIELEDKAAENRRKQSRENSGQLDSRESSPAASNKASPTPSPTPSRSGQAMPSPVVPEPPGLSRPELVKPEL